MKKTIRVAATTTFVTKDRNGRRVIQRFPTKVFETILSGKGRGKRARKRGEQRKAA